MTLGLAGATLVDGDARPADVVVEGGRVAAVGPGAAAGADFVHDLTGLLVAPGFVDLQLNGAHGLDLTTRPDDVWSVAAALPRYGVTSFLPTTVTAPLPTYHRALAALAAGPPAGWRGALPLGWHFEGPMLNPARKGAHTARHLRPPSPEIYGGWSSSQGVAMVTLAPELPGALDAVRHLVADGVVVSVGHTDATAAEVRAAVDAGASALTHLFNAMAPLGHRAPGPVGVTLAGGPIVAGLVADGIHVDPDVVSLAWRCLGPDRLALVTDAVGALGLPPGPQRIGDLEVILGPAGVRTADGTLAGSDLAMDRAVRNLVAFSGCSASEALRCATRTPANVLRRTDVGTLAPGARADAVVLTPELEVVATLVAGEVVWGRLPGR